MNEIIKKLDENLSTLRPEFYSSLQEALNDLEINKLEQQYKRKIPNDLRALYTWKNGQDDECYDAFVNNSTFISLEEALEIASENTSMIGHDFEIENWWNENWIPIFHNGGGDFICYDLEGSFTNKPGQLIEFWHNDTDRNVIAPNLEVFLSKLNDYFETRRASDFDEYFELDEIENYPKKFNIE